jgi:hypothetical protein
MAITVEALIRELQEVASTHGGDQIVITDNEASVIGAEYNTENGAPAVVIVTE